MATYRNLHDALVPELKRLAAFGQPRHSRNGTTMELMHHSVSLLRPRERFLFHPARADNPFAKVAESLWVLAGRNDVDWLSYYLPRAKDFSDDGYKWRAGYGPRLRAWPGMYDGMRVDQLHSVYQRLSTNPDDRQAVISLWDPARDGEHVSSKDFPCNNWLHFLVRDGQLHLAVGVRSNDVWWGWSGINTFEWSLLQEVLASWLGVGVGTHTTFASSWHLYERHWFASRRVIADEAIGLDINPYTDDESMRLVDWSTPYWKLRTDLNEFFRIEYEMRNPVGFGADLEWADVASIANPWLRTAAEMLRVYVVLTNGGDRATVTRCLETMENTDFKHAASRYVDWSFARAEREAAHGTGN